MIERGSCEAPTHNPTCPCITCKPKDCASCPLMTLDHFTPRSIAKKVLGWNRRRVNTPSNLQWLSEPCHIDKDRSTPAKLHQAEFQLKGGTIHFKQHR
jgi:hypothetical protein